MKIISINNFPLKKKARAVFSSIFILLLSHSFLIASDCSFDCWNQVYLQGGQLECSETVGLEDNFDGNALDYSVWQTYYFEDLNCFFDYFPSQFNGFVYGNSFFTNADCSYCPNDRSLSGSSSSSSKVDVHNSIQSTSKIQGTPIVYYNAGNRIQLQNGFSVSANATFSAKIKPCDP